MPFPSREEYSGSTLVPSIEERLINNLFLHSPVFSESLTFPFANEHLDTLIFTRLTQAPACIQNGYPLGPYFK